MMYLTPIRDNYANNGMMHEIPTCPPAPRTSSVSNWFPTLNMPTFPQLASPPDETGSDLRKRSRMEFDDEREEDLQGSGSVSSAIDGFFLMSPGRAAGKNDGLQGWGGVAQLQPRLSPRPTPAVDNFGSCDTSMTPSSFVGLSLDKIEEDHPKAFFSLAVLPNNNKRRRRSSIFDERRRRRPSFAGAA